MGSRFAAILRAVTAALTLLCAPPASASEGSDEASGSGAPVAAALSPEQEAKRLFDAAQAAATAGDRLGAAALYDELVSRFPSLRIARIARLKGRQLRALQSDPEPDLRAAFEDAKANFSARGAERSTATIRALEPRAQSPALQQDISLWIAGADARAGVPAKARARYTALLARETLTPSQANATVAGLLHTSTSLADRFDARARIHRALNLRPDQVAPAIALRLSDEADDHLYALFALYGSGVTLLLTLLRLLFAFGRRTAPLPAGFWRPGLLFPLYAFAGAGLFADGWEHGRLLPFVGAGVAVTLLLLLLRVADALRPPTGRWRFAAAALHLATMLAALYLVLYGTNLQHLMGL